MSPARRKGYVLKYRVPHAEVAAASVGPYAIAERIGGHSARWRWPTALGVTVALHALFTLLAFLGDQEHRKAPPPPQQVVTLERPPPPPEEPPEPPPPPKRPRPTASAEAGKVVAAVPNPNQPVDLTSFTMPVGTSDAYAGGFTAPSGTSAVAVPTPVVARPSGKARAASPARRDWSCPWPEEEQSSDLHDASVRIRIRVSEDGRATGVDVLASPKDSFAEAARGCALSEPFRPELDDAGHPVAGITPPISVHFVR